MKQHKGIMKNSNIAPWAIAERIAEQYTGGPVSRCGEGYSVRCPCHGDKTPSLVIYPGKRINQFVYIYRAHCYAGCSKDTIERWIAENLDIQNYIIDEKHPETIRFKKNNPL